MRKFVEFNNVVNNEVFWKFFMVVNFPDGSDEEEEMTVWEVMEEQGYLYYSDDTCKKWEEEFTQSFDGVFEEYDGCVENPTTIEIKLKKDTSLFIEFHPGVIIYFLNDNELGETGPHSDVRKISWSEFCEYTTDLDDRQAFLLLPMVYIEDHETSNLTEFISRTLDVLNFIMIWLKQQLLVILQAKVNINHINYFSRW